MKAAASQDTEVGAIAFVTTHWSMVLTAQGRSPAAQDALEKLCRAYWWPLYAFVRRRGVGPEEAEDLTQAFFARLLERRDLDAVRQEKGRLRSYLLVALKHFLANEHHRSNAIKRGEGQRVKARLALFGQANDPDNVVRFLKGLVFGNEVSLHRLFCSLLAVIERRVQRAVRRRRHDPGIPQVHFRP